MLRRTILVLHLSGLLAACHGTVLYRDFHIAESIPIDCDRAGNFTGCATKVQEIGDKENQSAVDTDRTITNEATDEIDKEELEVTGRRKKNRGYGQLLLYFLGASKLTMLYVIINAVAAIAGKALIVAKVALAIATAIALKKSEHKEKVSYEIIKHPHHSYEHTHSSSIDYDHHGYGEGGDFNYRKRRRIL